MNCPDCKKPLDPSGSSCDSCGSQLDDGQDTDTATDSAPLSAEPTVVPPVTKPPGAHSAAMTAVGDDPTADPAAPAVVLDPAATVSVPVEPLDIRALLHRAEHSRMLIALSSSAVVFGVAAMVVYSTRG